MLDGRVQADGLDSRIALFAFGDPLVMPVQDMAVAGNEDRTVAAGEAHGLAHLLKGVLRLRGLEAGGRHFHLFVSDTARVEEIDHGATVLSLDLRHVGARDSLRAGLRLKVSPVTRRICYRFSSCLPNICLG
ncbi:hypothetical protein D9M73_62620 [compost metagenome]